MATIAQDRADEPPADLAAMIGPAPLALFGRALGIRMARGIDHDAVIAAVREDAGWSNRFAFMTLMSAGIALLGLLLSSPAVVIGAMLVSPLMGPIIGLGFAFATFDWPRVRESLWALAGGAALAVGFCALIALVSPLQSATSEILARTRPNLFDLLVAVFSALAGAYATVRAKGATIVGVAIATALMPPLAVVGFGMATGQRAIWMGALTLFVTNFVAIAASAAVMARLYGFGSRLSPRQTRLQAWLVAGLMVVLAVPLAWALRDIAAEAAAMREVRRAIAEVLGEEVRLTGLEVRPEAGALRVEAVAVAPGFAPDARRRVEAEVQRRTGRAVTLHLVQVRAEDSERIANAEAQRAGEARRSAAEAEMRALRARLALVAGKAPDSVTIDPQTRLARATLAPGSEVSIGRLRRLEAQMAADFADWTIRLVPAAGTSLPVLAFDPGSAMPPPDSEPLADDIAWALARWGAPGAVVTGSAVRQGDAERGATEVLALARAEAVAQLLRARGVPALARTATAPAPAELIERGAAAYRIARVTAASTEEAALARAAQAASPEPAPGADASPAAAAMVPARP